MYTSEALRQVIKVIAVTSTKVKLCLSHMKDEQTISSNQVAEQEIRNNIEEIANVEVIDEY